MICIFVFLTSLNTINYYYSSKMATFINYKVLNKEETQFIEDMQSNKLRIDKFCYEYDYIKMIGKGSYGIVWLCERKGRAPPTPFTERFFDK